VVDVKPSRIQPEILNVVCTAESKTQTSKIFEKQVAARTSEPQLDSRETATRKNTRQPHMQADRPH